MELEFNIKMTAGILYDYLLRHTYNSASGLIGTGVGALMVIWFFAGGGIPFLIAGVVILLYLPWTLFIKSRQQMLNTPAFRQPLHYKLTEEGIEVSQGETVQTQPWGQMYKAVSTTKSIIVYTSPVNASIFPKSDLRELTPQVIRIISTHMPPDKVKIRW
ncbi:MAG: YcxB family protein [Lachnospiraceae bacterium]|nr:YcxB family protein [Lachnospiraceae bacterium]